MNRLYIIFILSLSFVGLVSFAQSGTQLESPSIKAIHNVRDLCLQGRYSETVEELNSIINSIASLKPNERDSLFSCSAQVVSVLSGKRLFNDAIELCQNILAAYPSFLDSEKEIEASLLYKLGELHYHLGDVRASVSYWESALNKYKSFSEGYSDLIPILESNLGSLYGVLKDSKKSVQYYQAALMDKHKITPDEDDLTATIYNKLGLALFNEGNTADAIRMVSYALELREKMYGKNSRQVAESSDNLGWLYMQSGDYFEAERYFKEALSIDDAIKDFDHLLIVYDDFRALYEGKGLVNESREWDFKYLSLQRELFIDKNNQKELPPILDRLASHCYALGDYLRAIKYKTEVIDILKRSESATDIKKIALEQKDISTLYHLSGLNKNAIDYAQEALTNYSKLGQVDTVTLWLYNSIGTIYDETKNHDKAQVFLLRALHLADSLGLTDKSIVYNNLSLTYSHQGDISKALEYANKALSEKLSIANYPQASIATSYNNIGTLYFKERDYPNAEINFNKALAIRKEIFGTNKIDVSTSLHNLAQLYDEQGDYEKAKDYLLEAIKFTNYDDAAVLPTLINDVLLIYEHSHNDEYDQVASQCMRVAIDSIKAVTLRDFTILTEKDRSSYWENKWAVALPYFYNIANDLSLYSKQDVDWTYDLALFSKGLLLNSTKGLNNLLSSSSNAELISMADSLLAIKSAILKTEDLQERSDLYSTASRYESRLLEKSLGFANYTTDLLSSWLDIQKCLSDNDVAIEFVNYNAGSRLNRITYDRYSAIVLKKGWDHPLYRSITITDEELSILKAVASDSDSYDSETGRQCYNLIWGRLADLIDPDDNVFFSPSGLLNLINIEALPNSNKRTASSQYNLHRVSSTRQLLKKSFSDNYISAALFGGLNYESDTTAALNPYYPTGDYSSKRSIVFEKDLTRSGWAYLPGTRKEVEGIYRDLTDSGLSVNCFFGNDGTEESFKSLSGQQTDILHVATHGFYLDNESLQSVQYNIPGVSIKNLTSMQRSGLILSGGQNAWLGKDIPNNVEDGICFSDEISLMDLTSTELMVLSSCETALGDLLEDGVFGLQRAFKLAGVRTIIMTLWRVDDNSSVLFMNEFYKRLSRGVDRHSAFSEALSVIKEKYPEPYYWAPYIMLD